MAMLGGKSGPVACASAAAGGSRKASAATDRRWSMGTPGTCVVSAGVFRLPGTGARESRHRRRFRRGLRRAASVLLAALDEAEARTLPLRRPQRPGHDGAPRDGHLAPDAAERELAADAPLVEEDLGGVAPGHEVQPDELLLHEVRRKLHT